MWSDELQEQTREYFKHLPFGAMKQFGTDVFGIGALRDGQYIVTDRTTKEQYVFTSVDELITAKWAID